MDTDKSGSSARRTAEATVEQIWQTAAKDMADDAAILAALKADEPAAGGSRQE